MHLLNKTFPPLHNLEAVDELYQFFLGRRPTHSQHLWIRNNANDQYLTNGVMAFSQPWDSAKPVLVIYGCCHSAQLLCYWINFSLSNHIKETYNLVYLSNYRIMSEANYGLPMGQPHTVAGIPDDYRELFLVALGKADLVITHPAYGGAEFDPKCLVTRFCRTDTPVIRFHSPSFGALWPVCIFGDEHVKAALRSGVTADQIKSALSDGNLFCHLQERFALAFQRMQKKDSLVDIKIGDFFSRHWRTHRMMITVNHPSFHLMAYQAVRIEATAESCVVHEPTVFDGHACLSLPWNACNFQPVWPDHHAANRELGLSYPDEYPDSTGCFYGGEIERCAREVAEETV